MSTFHVPLGQYVEQNSVIHRLDPRTKIAWILLFMISILFLDQFFTYLFAFLFLGGCLVLSKVSIHFIMRGLKPIWFICTFTFVVHLLLTPSETPFAKLAFIYISFEGFTKAMTVTTKIVLLVVAASLFTCVTKQSSLTDGLIKLGKPLQKYGVPVHEFAFMVSITMRFIPLFIRELETIVKAQRARGLQWNEGNLLKRIAALFPVFIPLIISSIQKAEQMTLAIQARGYRPGIERTPLTSFQFGTIDGIALLIFLFYFVFIVFIV